MYHAFVIYPAPDLAASKAWYIKVLGTEPYFDEPFYVGFNVGGYELGLNPGMKTEEGAVSYWGVANADAAHEQLLKDGAKLHSGIDDVGDGIRVATVLEPSG